MQRLWCVLSTWVTCSLEQGDFAEAACPVWHVTEPWGRCGTVVLLQWPPVGGNPLDLQFLCHQAESLAGPGSCLHNSDMVSAEDVRNRSWRALEQGTHSWEHPKGSLCFPLLRVLSGEAQTQGMMFEGALTQTL